MSNLTGRETIFIQSLVIRYYLLLIRMSIKENYIVRDIKLQQPVVEWLISERIFTEHSLKSQGTQLSSPNFNVYFMIFQ